MHYAKNKKFKANYNVPENRENFIYCAFWAIM